MPATEKEFVLTHVIRNISNSKEGKYAYSAEEEHFGVSWKIGYVRENESMGLYLFSPSNKEKKWSIDTQFSLKLMSANGKNISKSSLIKNFGNSTDKNGTNWGWDHFIRWEELKKNYVIDDKVTIEVHVKILKMTGIGKKKLRNFDESVQELSDVTLIVEDKKFYVSKLFLAGQSFYFKELFDEYEAFEESGKSYFKAFLLKVFHQTEKSEITLTDVNAKDFQNFLEVLYGEPAIDGKGISAYFIKTQELSDSTISGILQLADMYDAQTVIRQCEEFLMEKSEKTLKEKLEISAGFNLKKLKNKCLLEVKTSADIKSVVSGDVSKMDHSVLADLFLKSLSLH